MKIKAMNSMLDGFETEARLTTDHPASSYGRPVLVLADGEPLGTADATLAGYTIMKATAKERAALKAAGFHLPDYVPEGVEA